MKRFALFLFALCCGPAAFAGTTPGFQAGFLSHDLTVTGNAGYNDGIYVGDLNHDGHEDVVATTIWGDVSTLFGTAACSFQVGPFEATGLNGLHSTTQGGLYDVDGDGELDLVALNESWAAASIVMLKGDGAGHFLSPRTIAVHTSDGYFEDAAVGEFTGDGILDLAVARTRATNTYRDLVIYAGTASGLFTALPVLSVGTTEWTGLVVYARDLDGDGRDELVWTGDNCLFVYKGLAGGGFAPRITVPVPDPPGNVAAGDFDGDGHLDLTTQARYVEGFWICRANGLGGFAAATFEPTAIYRGPVRCGDTDGDGKDEILTSGAQAIAEPVDGTLDSRLFPLRNGADVFDAADFDGDGHVDFVALEEIPYGANTSNPAAVTVALSPPNGAGIAEIPTGTSPNDVVLADVDRDGNLDAITPDSGSDQVTILWGDGAGAFPARTDVVVGDGPESVAIADLDGDAWPDLVVSEQNAKTLGVLRGLGGRSFAGETAIPSAPQARGLTVGDVTGDGIADAVVGLFFANQVLLFAGDGAGGFTAGTPLATGGGPQQPLIVDLDRDGNLDLVYALWVTAAVAVRYGQPGGGLGAEELATASSRTSHFEVIDADHDGLLDLVSSGDQDGSINVARADGSGSFGWYGRRTAVQANDLASGDFDGDGLPEVAFLGSEKHRSGTIGIDEALGPGGSAASSFLYGGGLGATSIAAGDVNHDGRPDFVTASKTRSTVSVVLNRNTGPIVAVPPAASVPSRLRFASRMPARGPFALAYDAPSADEGSIRILTARGAVVYRAKFLPNAAGAQMVRVAPTGLRGGVYWAEVRQGSFRDVVKFVFVP